jgi:hypothetical protein
MRNETKTIELRRVRGGVPVQSGVKGGRIIIKRA